MAIKKIDDFTAVTAAAGSDVALVSQDGVTKKLPLSLAPISAAAQAALDTKAVAKVAAAQFNLSADGTTRQLAAQTAPAFGPTTDLGLAPVIVDTTVPHQSVLGWGAALTDASAQLMSTSLTAAQQTAMLNEMFAADQGNFNLVRISIGASDFTATAYTLDDEPLNTTDPNLTDFALSSDDLAYKIPLLRKIRAINPNVKILASPWSPPAWMKTNPAKGISGTGTGNEISTAYLQQYANYIVKFIQAYAAVGIPIFAVTPQNEPENNTSGWPTCYMSAPQQATLIGTYLGPALTTAGLATRVWAWDHNYSNPTYPKTVLANAAAAQYVDAVAWHWYDGQPEDGMAPVALAYPNVKQIVSEACGVPYMQGTVANFHRRIFIGAMRNGSVGVILWNILLDQNGGPANYTYTPPLKGLYGIDTTSGTLTKNTDLWALFTSSRYVKPGAVRVRSTSSLTGVQTVAYTNPDRSTVLIAYNSTAAAVSTQVADAVMHQSFALTLPAGEVAVIVWTGAVTGTTAPAITAPAAPTLTATGKKGGVTLAISAPTPTDPVAAVFVLRGTTLVAVLPASTTTWTDTGAPVGGASSYTAYASNGGGAGTTSAAATATALAATAPAAPGKPAITAGTITAAAPSDTGGATISAYKIYRSTTSGSGATLIATVPVTRGATGVSYTDAATGTNYYTVTAVNSVGESSASAETSYSSGASGNRSIATPTTTTQPALWLRSDAISGATDGSALTSWPDSSGNGYTAVVPSGGSAPTFRTSIVGSSPAVRFANPSGAAASAVQRMVAPYGIKGEDVTVLLVAKLTTGTNTAMPLIEGATSDAKVANSFNMFYYNSYVGVAAQGNSSTANSSSFTNTAPFMIAGSIDTAANSHVFKSTANRQASGSATPGAYTSAAAVGTAIGGVGNDYTAGISLDVLEVIVFPKILADADRVTWSQYLSQIYPSITVGSN